MAEPRVIPRAEHTLSRADCDPDALKVLYRLRQGDHIAYLVGGSVRDCFWDAGRRILTSGPRRIRIRSRSSFATAGSSAAAFASLTSSSGPRSSKSRRSAGRCSLAKRSCRTGCQRPSIITPRRPNPATPGTHDCGGARARRRPADTPGQYVRHAGGRRLPSRLHDQRVVLRHRHVLDHRLRRRSRGSARVHRPLHRRSRSQVPRRSGSHAARDCAGCAARLPDRPAYPRGHSPLRHEIANSSAPRLLEEYYKILRAGSSEKTFRGLAEAGLIEPISHELHNGAGDALWRSLANVDAYRQKFSSTPETLTNAVLLGSLLAPLGLAPQPGRAPAREATDARHREPLARLGSLPLARRDLERLRQILGLQRRLRDLTASVRTQRALTHRSISVRRLPGWKSMATHPRWSSTGLPCSLSAERRNRSQPSKVESDRGAGADGADDDSVRRSSGPHPGDGARLRPGPTTRSSSRTPA